MLTGAFSYCPYPGAAMVPQTLHWASGACTPVGQVGRQQGEHVPSTCSGWREVSEEKGGDGWSHPALSPRATEFVCGEGRRLWCLSPSSPVRRVPSCSIRGCSWLFSSRTQTLQRSKQIQEETALWNFLQLPGTCVQLWELR